MQSDSDQNLTPEEAQQLILDHIPSLGSERVDLLEAPGRVLAESVSARADTPPWDNSAMDGYAVRTRDIADARMEAPISLWVAGEIRAGDRAGRVLAQGEAVRIMTGAPVPPGADAVVRVEDTDAEEDPGTVRIFSAPQPGGDIRPGGQDMREGEKLLSRGTTIGPGQIGLLAASGAPAVQVHERPRVAVLSNGDEIAAPHEFHRVLKGKAIPETNSPTLVAGVLGAGGLPRALGIARDTSESILEKLAMARSMGADVLVTSGGASMGEYDLFKRVLDQEDFRQDFWRVKMRPGTPFSFGVLPAPGDGGRPMFVFGLPGNPASSFVTFQVFCRPFLLRLAGHGRIHRPVVLARARENFSSPEPLTHFFRVRLSGDPAAPEAEMTGPQTSGLVRGQGLAHGLAVVPEGVEEVKRGHTLRVMVLDDFGHGGDEAGYLPA